MKQLFVGVGTTSMCFLALENKTYLDLSKIYGFAEYLKIKRAKELLEEYTNVVVDLNEDAIHRMVIYNKNLELNNNDRLYYVGDDGELKKARKELEELRIFSLVSDYLQQSS